MSKNKAATAADLFEMLEEINDRPRPFEHYTAKDLWTDEHTSERMLSFHLNGEIDVSSRKTGFIDLSAQWIVSEFKVGAQTRIADFGCGPGLYTTRLARTGARVTGIDFSRRSIDHARATAAQEGLAIQYLNQNYLELQTKKRFDLILMIMGDYCALSPSQRKEILAEFRGLLRPGGSVLLDVYSLTAFARREENTSYQVNLLNGFWSPGRYHGFQNTFKYQAEKVVLDKYTIIEAHLTRTVYNWLQYFSPESLEKEFADSGFGIKGLFADVTGRPFDPGGNEFAVVAGMS